MVKGRGVGKSKLGFPTININSPKFFPQSSWGIYIVKVEIDSSIYNGVAHVGPLLTFHPKQVTCEAFLFNTKKDFYEKKVSLKLVKKIRDVQKFESLKDLKSAIANDVKIAKKFFN